MAKKQQKSEGGQSFGVQKDKGKGIQKERVRRTRSSSRVKGSENPKTPTTAKTSKKRKEKPTPPDSDTDFDIPLNVHRKKKAPAVAEPAVKKRAAVQFRCKTRPLLDVNGKIVQHPRRNTIRRDQMDANFHGLLDLQVDLINKELCSFVMASYDPKTRTFVFPNGEVLIVEPTDVARVYGLPSHGIPINIKSCPTAERRKFEATSRLGGNRHNNVKLATLKKSIEECQDGNAFSRMYILHSLGTLLVPGNSWKISLNYEKYLNEEFSLIGQLNWGKYVVDTLLMGLDDFQSKLSYPSGDFNFLVLCYLYQCCLDLVMQLLCVVNAIGHYLNKEHMERNDSITRMCFPICVAVAAWEEVEAKRLLSLSDSIVAQRMA
ncbi:hypothetical protein LINPERPRIM_LOCUS27255 [Linum perenne]